MSSIPSLVTFTAGTRAKAAEVNANFSAIRTAVNTYGVFVDTAATITGVWAFSTSPTFAAPVTFSSTVTATGALTASAGISVTTGGVTITAGGVTITAGGLTVTAGASTFGAAVSITGTCTATTFSGSGASLTNLDATQLTGTINNSRMPTAISVTTVATSGAMTSGGGFVATAGASYGARTTSSGGNVTIDASTTNHHRHTLTGNGTITLANLSDSQLLYVEVLQDGTGSRTLAFSGVTSWPGGNVTPTFTTTASRKDVWIFRKCGADIIAHVGGQNYVSTS